MGSEDTLSGWGRLALPGHELRSEDLSAITIDAPISRGLGRSYGDASLPPADRPVAAGSRLADRFLGFDQQSGLLRAEAGLSLYELNRLFWPRGWSSPVLTGTQFVTLAGMVASDVHGKNHHIDGTIGNHIELLRLRLADGRVVECGPDLEPDLFTATLGGMGLTGHILEVSIRLQPIPSPWILAETERISDLDHFLRALQEAAQRWPFTVGWLDGLKSGRSMGRGILFRGRWAEPAEAPSGPPPPIRRLQVPCVFPSWALNRLSVSLFNAVYYWKHWPRMRRGIVHPETFFHPLDAVRSWNRIYGPQGFTQYQCVIPDEQGPEGVRRFFKRLTDLGVASFLCVIKDCGSQGRGLLSFPMPGTSIAVDIAVRENTQDLIDQLNETLIAEGGRIYLTKDAFTRPEHFRAMEPRLAAWHRARKRFDPDHRLASAQSRRLFGAGA